MRFLLVAGTTATATIDGISAAGASPELMAHTPAADAEVVAYGHPVFAPFVPISPEGCPTPALVTRAVRDLVDIATVTVDAGMGARTAAPTVALGDEPGKDVREAEAVPNAAALFDAAAAYAAGLPDDALLVGETIPGGTTTALGVLRALGEEYGVSSSLPANPLSLKAEVVADGLAASGLDPGDLAGDPIEAVRRMGDPTLAVTAGVVDGALDAGKDVTVAGGTQMLAAASLVRHRGVEDSFTVATTSFVADDDTVDVRAAADALDVDLRVTDPGFDREDHVATDHYLAGVAKEGVGMGGALALAADRDVPMADVRAQLLDRYDDLVGDDGA